MLLFRLALFTCLVYLTAVALMELAIFILARSLGSFAFGGKPLGWTIWFGGVWLISFRLAWYISAIRPAK
jgi:hypothetical protein